MPSSGPDQFALTKALAAWEGPSPSQVTNVFVMAAGPVQLALTKALATWGGPSSSQVAKVFVSDAVAVTPLRGLAF